MSKRDRKRTERQTLDAVADFAAGARLAGDELDQALRAEGYDPDSLADRVLAEVKRRTWKFGLVRAGTPARPVRPSHADKAYLLKRLADVSDARRQTVNFKNANELSEDDLWDILLDMESKGDP